MNVTLHDGRIRWNDQGRVVVEKKLAVIPPDTSRQRQPSVDSNGGIADKSHQG